MVHSVLILFLISIVYVLNTCKHTANVNTLDIETIFFHIYGKVVVLESYGKKFASATFY